MSTLTHPDITCTKCDSVVPWGPHCPQCRAYLEFAGMPPWQPDPPAEAGPEGISEPAADSPAPENSTNGAVTPPIEGNALDAAPSADAVEMEQEHAPGPIAVAVGETVEQVTAQTQTRHQEASSRWGLWCRSWKRQPGLNLLACLLAVLLGVALALLLCDLIHSWDGLWATPLFTLICLLVFWWFVTIPDQRAFEESQVEPELEPEPVVAQAEPVPTSEPEIDSIQSHAPQLVDVTQEKTAALLDPSAIVRSQECAECGHLNVREAHYCEACTAMLPGAVVSPPIIAYSLVEEHEQGQQGDKPKGKRRRLSGSWRNVVMGLTIAGIAASAIIFAFFGPGAMRVQFGMTRAFQVINQWIDPYSGTRATVTKVTTSSTIDGIESTALQDADVRTFWVSADLPDYGTGIEIVWTLDEPSLINRMVIYPGIQNQQFDRRALATPKDITLTFDDGTSVQRTLNPLDSSEEFRQLLRFDDVTTQQIKMRIDSVYPPREGSADRIGEVAISGVQFIEVPQPPKIFAFQNGPRVPTLPGVPVGK